jgi:hypothetical protein
MLNEWMGDRLLGDGGSGSCLWYASESAESRMMKAGRSVPGPRVPNVWAEPELLRTKYLVGEMPPELRAVLHFKYEVPGPEGRKVEAFRKSTGQSTRTFYRRVDALWDYIIERHPIPVRDL